MSKAISLPLIGGFAKNQNTSQVRAPKINGRVTWVSHAPSKSTASARKSSLPLLNIALSVLIGLQVVVSVAYLFGINLSAAKGFEVSQINKQINKLTIDQQRLQLSVAEKTTLNSLESAMPQGFVQVTDTEFAHTKLSNK
jgi:hypothetical protein